MDKEFPFDKEDLLAHRYRRRLLYCLYFHTTPMKLSDVADQLTVWDSQIDENEYLQERLRIYDALYYDHLPMIQETKLVNYSQRNDTITLGPAAAKFESIVREKFSTELTDLLAEEWNSPDT